MATFKICVRKQRKDLLYPIYINLNRSGDFTVAFATKDTMVASDFVGIVRAKNDPQKMQKTSWTAIKAENVDAPVFTDDIGMSYSP